MGIVGGGQLARMLALAGIPLGLRFVFVDQAPDACAAPLGLHLTGALTEHMDQLAALCDVVTFDSENVPSVALAALKEMTHVRPSAVALALGGDRLREKTLFRELDIPTPEFLPVDCGGDLEKAVTRVGLPAVLKTRTMGYDGKGQAVVRRREDLAGVWERLGRRPLIVEELVPFDREISALTVRSASGSWGMYPVVENTHREGILRISRTRPGDRLENQAKEYMRRLLDRLDYVGVLALEMFQVGDRLLANEMAPRVHNSGHWTIEGAETSQFENHLRAILDLPLGSTTPVGYAAMVNLVGAVPEPDAVLSVPGAHLHLYGKVRRARRKLGHVTLRASTETELEARLARLLALLGETVHSV